MVGINSRVFDKADPRFTGRVLSIVEGVALIEWFDSGWLSQIPVRNLRLN